jgi:hypothetical protein
MKKPIPRRAILRAVAVLAAPAAIVTAAAPQRAAAVPDDPLIAGFNATCPASVSDAVELVTGKATVGRAVTSLARPAPPEGATPALATKHSVASDFAR